MRRILAAILLLGIPQLVHAHHTFFFGNASQLTQGTVANNLLDNSSVTKQGNTFNGASQLVQANINSKIANSLLQITSYHRAWDIAIGSLTANSLEVDIASNNSNGITQAITNLTGSANATSGVGSIFLKPGVYTWSGATIPAGVSLYCTEGSSTMITNTAQGKPILTIYGKVSGCTFDLNHSSNANISPLFEMKNGGQFLNNKVINGDYAQPGVDTFYIVNTTNVDISGNKIVNYVHGNGGNATKTVFDINGSSDIRITRNDFYSGSAVVGSEIVAVQSSNRLLFENNNIWEAQAAFIREINGGVQDLVVRRNFFNCVANLAANGFIEQIGATKSSTATAITDNVWIINGNLSGKISNFSNSKTGVLLSGNILKGTGTNGITFLTLGSSGVFGLVAMNNWLANINVFISDSGTGTVYTGVGNFMNSLQQ